MTAVLAIGAMDPEKGTAEETEYAWQQKPDSLALLRRSQVVWQYNYRKSEGKPYFHPLGTVDGEVLTWLRPADHVWHRAMWHSWKSINGLNYWEEDRTTLLSKGRTEIVDVTVRTAPDHTAEIRLKLSYHPPDKPEILSEERLIKVAAPDEKGLYRVDWLSTTTATGEDARLDRTPPPGEPGGKGHGGYAGFSIRMAKATRGWAFTNSEGLQGRELHGKHAAWLHAGGTTPSGKNAALTILDHPANGRHPSPWYLAEHMPYFSPAVLFDEPFVLKKGESVTLKYRVLVHSGACTREELDAEWKAFAR